MQGVESVVGVEVPPALAGIGIGDQSHGLRADVVDGQMPGWKYLEARQVRLRR